MHDLDGLRQAWTAHERRAMARVGPCGTPTPAQADRPRPRRHRCNRVCPPRPKSPVSTHSYFEKPREVPTFIPEPGSHDARIQRSHQREAAGGCPDMGDGWGYAGGVEAAPPWAWPSHAAMIRLTSSEKEWKYSTL